VDGRSHRQSHGAQQGERCGVLLEVQLEAPKYGDGKISVYETTGVSEDGITTFKKKKNGRLV